jgi:hypothetical protein
MAGKQHECEGDHRSQRARGAKENACVHRAHALKLIRIRRTGKEM